MTSLLTTLQNWELFQLLVQVSPMLPRYLLKDVLIASWSDSLFVKTFHIPNFLSISSNPCRWHFSRFNFTKRKYWFFSRNWEAPTFFNRTRKSFVASVWSLPAYYNYPGKSRWGNLPKHEAPLNKSIAPLDFKFLPWVKISIKNSLAKSCKLKSRDPTPLKV